MCVSPRVDVHVPSWRVLIVEAENRSSLCQRKPLGARLLVGALSCRCPGTRGRQTRNYLDSKKIISKSHGSMSDGAAIFAKSEQLISRISPPLAAETILGATKAASSS